MQQAPSLQQCNSLKLLTAGRMFFGATGAQPVVLIKIGWELLAGKVASLERQSYLTVQVLVDDKRKGIFIRLSTAFVLKRLTNFQRA